MIKAGEKGEVQKVTNNRYIQISGPMSMISLYCKLMLHAKKSQDLLSSRPFLLKFS